MKKFLFVATLFLFASQLHAAKGFGDRFVWIFGWNLENDKDVAEISKVLETAGKNHFNGAVVSFGFDTLTKKSPDFLRRLDSIALACEKNRLELVPSLFSIGYGGGILAHNPNLAEGLPVVDAPLVVHGSQARLAPGNPVQFRNGDFEDFTKTSSRVLIFATNPAKSVSRILKSATAEKLPSDWKTSRPMRTAMVASCKRFRCSLTAATE